jgi:hypothetical protein
MPPACSLLAPCQTNASPGNRFCERRGFVDVPRRSHAACMLPRRALPALHAPAARSLGQETVPAGGRSKAFRPAERSAPLKGLATIPRPAFPQETNATSFRRGCAPHPTRTRRGDPNGPTPRPRGAHVRALGRKGRNCETGVAVGVWYAEARWLGGHTWGGRWERASRSANRRRRAGVPGVPPARTVRGRGVLASGLGAAMCPLFPRCLVQALC